MEAYVDHLLWCHLPHTSSVATIQKISLLYYYDLFVNVHLYDIFRCLIYADSCLHSVLIKSSVSKETSSSINDTKERRHCEDMAWSINDISIYLSKKNSNDLHGFCLWRMKMSLMLHGLDNIKLFITDISFFLNNCMAAFL